MTLLAALASALAALAALVWLGPRPGAVRLARLARLAADGRRRGADGLGAVSDVLDAAELEGVRGRRALGRWRWRASPHGDEPGSGASSALAAVGVPVLAGLVAAVVLGGSAGIVAGIAVAGVTAWAVRRAEPRSVRLRRERLVADLPLALELLVACLRAGQPPERGLDAVARSLGGPLGRELVMVAAALRLGAEPSSAWQRLLDEPALASFARTMVRAVRTGAPIADVLGRQANDARLARRFEAERRARSVGVKAAAPLGLCFLPAFVLVGIVPIAAGAVASLLR